MLIFTERLKLNNVTTLLVYSYSANLLNKNNNVKLLLKPENLVIMSTAIEQYL